jgi:hypothetical protein
MHPNVVIYQRFISVSADAMSYMKTSCEAVHTSPDSLPQGQRVAFLRKLEVFQKTHA